MAAQLREYRRKRDFSRTPEPAASAQKRAPSAGRFVVHEHHARSLHWDLRIEHEGVLLSWALPRGVPQLPDRSANRLAVRTEDHPLEYLSFEGEIPAGEYGGGRISIWDSGTYEAEKLRDDEVIAVFAGERMRGRYALFSTRGKNWIIHRMDPPLDPEREPTPTDLRPMLPRTGHLPRNQDSWGFEIAWGGLRTLLWCEPGHIRKAEARGGADAVELFPELRALPRLLGSTEAVLDGEITVLDDKGRPNAARLRERKGAGSSSAARRLATRAPATLILFDLLFLEGHLTIGLPYTERRRLLDELRLSGEAIQTPAWHRGEGDSLRVAARERGLAALIAKRLDGVYEPGRRSDKWRKVRA